MKMMKKSKAWNKSLWFIYMALLLLVLAVFVVRGCSGEYETKASDGQIIHVSKTYQMGRFYDRDGNDVTEDEMYSDIIGANISETMNAKSAVSGVTPWVFGLEDDCFRLKDLLNPYAKRVGGDARLTYDTQLMHFVKNVIQESGYEAVYVVVSNWKTGEVLATSGNVYTESMHPGSTIKPILAAAAISINPDLKKFTYECTTNNHKFLTENGWYTVDCAGGVNHGLMDMKTAIAKSCNGYFVSLLQQVSKDDLVKEMKKWGFDGVKSYEQFFYWDHKFLDNSEKDLDYLLAAIGQANAQITPFGMNLCTNAFLGGTGQIQEPRRVLAKKASPEDEWVPIEIHKSNTFCGEVEAKEIQSYMLEVAKSGTLKKYNMEGFAGKTGTAQYENFNAVWTTGGLVKEETPYSVTVCIYKVDKSVSSGEAGKMVKKILDYMVGGEKA